MEADLEYIPELRTERKEEQRAGVLIGLFAVE